MLKCLFPAFSLLLSIARHLVAGRIKVPGVATFRKWRLSERGETMKALMVGVAAVVGLVVVGSRVPAQELVPTPDAIGGAPSGAAAGAPAAPVPSSPDANNWRYRWHEGRWWYWTPQNRWKWYSNDGRWVDFDANHPPATNAAPVPHGGYSVPVAPYWAGYYPGVAVDVRPFGNVSVAVGRRVGVDVYGPHGGVRVGRICVAW